MKTSKLLFVALLCLAFIAGGGLLSAQAHQGSANQEQPQNTAPAQATPSPQASPGPSPQARPGLPGKVEVEPEKPQHRLTPEEAKDLFQSLDELLHFASKNTLLPIKHPVKRAVVSREEVEKYIGDKFKNDVDRIRFERSALVLKKLGLLPRKFDLHSFMIKLLGEQVAGYYDEKTKTMNLLDWVAPDMQKPVMAHELTHALQDQSFDLEKMSKHDEAIEKKGLEDLDELIRNDEESTARSAVVEGQAMIVFIKYTLASMGISDNDKVLAAMVDKMESTMQGSDNDSPVFDSAPLLLKEELMFPYTKGTIFIKDLLVKGDKKMAFAGALEHLPTTTREVLHPQEYIAGRRIPALLLPDVSFLKKDFEPYDAGAVGELDVDIMLKIYAGDEVAGRLSPEWRGGSYYAAGLKGAKPVDANSSAHVGLFYVSKWSTPASAQEFAKLYGGALATRYTNLQRSAADNSRPGLQKFSSADGPIFIQQTENVVVAVESFSQTDAEKLIDAGLKSARQQTLPPEQPPAATPSQ